MTAPEREQLTGWLDHQRSLVRRKCTGLSDADAHRKVLPTSPLMTPAGLVSHLRWNECSWFQLNLAGVPDTGQTPWTPDGHPDPERRTGQAASLRYTLCHLIEETARHIGHLDIIRALLEETACDHH